VGTAEHAEGQRQQDVVAADQIQIVLREEPPVLDDVEAPAQRGGNDRSSHQVCGNRTAGGVCGPHRRGHFSLAVVAGGRLDSRIARAVRYEEFHEVHAVRDVRRGRPQARGHDAPLLGFPAQHEIRAVPIPAQPQRRHPRAEVLLDPGDPRGPGPGQGKLDLSSQIAPRGIDADVGVKIDQAGQECASGQRERDIGRAGRSAKLAGGGRRAPTDPDDALALDRQSSGTAWALSHAVDHLLRLDPDHREPITSPRRS
jgi:hypothetical protein